jgi:hypothetical protein
MSDNQPPVNIKSEPVSTDNSDRLRKQIIYKSIKVKALI